MLQQAYRSTGNLSRIERCEQVPSVELAERLAVLQRRDQRITFYPAAQSADDASGKGNRSAKQRLKLPKENNMVEPSLKEVVKAMCKAYPVAVRLWPVLLACQ
jgi:hypothetical protein